MEKASSEALTPRITAATAQSRLGNLYRESARQLAAATIPGLPDAKRDSEVNVARRNAVAAYKKAHQLWKALAEGNPETDRYQVGDASALAANGDVEGELGRLPEAESAYEEAWSAFTHLDERSPEVPGVKADLVRLGTALGQVKMRLIKETEAIDAFTLALDYASIWNANRVAQSPDYVLRRINLADSHLGLGTALYWTGRTGRAAEEIQYAVAIARELSSSAPTILSSGSNSPQASPPSASFVSRTVTATTTARNSRRPPTLS